MRRCINKPPVLPQRSLYSGKSIFSFNKLNACHFTWQSTANRVILIPKGMLLAGTKDPARSRKHQDPYWHGLIKTEDPWWNKNSSHICIPCWIHLPHFPNGLEKGGFDIVRKPKFMSDAVKVILGHVVPEMEGAGILVFIMRDQTPKVVHCKAGGCCTWELQTNVPKELAFSELCYTLGN